MVEGSSKTEIQIDKIAHTESRDYSLYLHYAITLHHAPYRSYAIPSIGADKPR
jgi:hypothetical protein